MEPILGAIEGNSCPDCGATIEMEGAFAEGDEIACDCGATLLIDNVQATYVVRLTLLSAKKEA